MIQPRSITILNSVKVNDDTFEVILTVTRSLESTADKDMSIVKSEIERLLPSWIKSKIQAGEISS